MRLDVATAISGEGLETGTTVSCAVHMRDRLMAAAVSVQMRRNPSSSQGGCPVPGAEYTKVQYAIRHDGTAALQQQ